MPGEFIDTSKIATGVAERAIDRILSFAEAQVKERWARYKNKGTETFAAYIEAQSRRCAQIRTLIYDQQSSYLPDIYVPLRVSMMTGIGRRSSYDELTAEDLINLLCEEQAQNKKERPTLAAVLTGPAGAGKTFFMRNLYINLAKLRGSKVPIFLEARELNELPVSDFPDVVATAFRIAGHEISREQAIDGLKSGIFLILIDGFDELRVSQERHYARELERAAHEFQLCPLVVSGRPSELISAFAYFRSCKLLPLEPSQAVELIRKLNFIEATKESFIGLMKRELFDTHEEFLELPLLCVVMLLTYSDAGRISHKQHEFYEDAFNALWSKHDARKQVGYEREKYTGLDKNDFTRLLSAFCASSYVNEDFSMREAELISHLERARRLTDIRAKDHDFIRDMTISTSLLVQDGNAYQFSHRSFQEYFCARYVLGLGDADIAKGIDAVSTRYETDTVLNFIRSMNAERFERAWVIPRLSAIVPQMQKGEAVFANYNRVARDLSAQAIRKMYEMKPSNDQVDGAVVAWSDMRFPATARLMVTDEHPQSKLFLRDISNFENLLKKLSDKYGARANMRDALFGPKEAAMIPRRKRRPR